MPKVIKFQFQAGEKSWIMKESETKIGFHHNKDFISVLSTSVKKSNAILRLILI